MTTTRVAGLLLLLGAAPAALFGQTSLTIYNDGRVLVRRTVPLTLPKGPSTQRVTLGALDPATLFTLDRDVTLDGLAYDGAVDEGSALRRSVGRRLVFRRPESKDTVSALVRRRLAAGSATTTSPG